MRLKKSTIIFITALAFAIISYCSSCTLRNMVKYNFADINDYKIFPMRIAEASTKPYKYNYSKPSINLNNAIQQANNNFKDYLLKNKTVAFLIIKNDSIQHEFYLDNYDTASIVPSFSVAKSVTSILIGCAIKDGFIKDVQEPITHFIPELKKNGFEKVTIEHVLQMTSGIAFNESYWNPTGEAAKFYYGNKLLKYTTNLKLKREPGTKFEYVSGNTQLLGLILQRALKNISITNYLNQKIWQPLGMQYTGSWSLDDENGLEKTFCCLNARALDFAKIGSLYLHNGYWQGSQIVDSNWVKKSTTASLTFGSVYFYQYQWWLPSANGDYMAHGILGQYIYVNPAKNLVIVRLGKSEGKIDWENLFMQIADAY